MLKKQITMLKGEITIMLTKNFVEDIKIPWAIRLLKHRMHPPHERVSLNASIQIYTFVVISH
jgi:hypothetical protein